MRRLLTILFVAFALLLAAPHRAQAQEAAPAARERPAVPSKVVTGVYVTQVNGLSLRENTWHVSFYVWFRWSDAALDPLRSFDVTNGVVTKSQEVREKQGDTFYASCRCEAEMTQVFDVRRFPFDDHALRIEIEDTENEIEYLEYVCDSQNSAVAPDVAVPGWEIATASAEASRHGYTTNYGNLALERRADGFASVYSQFTFTVPLERRGGAYFAKLFFGLFIAVGIAMLAFFIKPTDLDPRFGLPVGAIFAAVGSLYVTSSLLPDTNVITLSDRLHILAFAVIFATLVQSTVSLRIYTGGDEDRSRRLDRTFFWALAALFLVGSSIAVVTS